MGKPKIRFHGYTEDWEQRKVTELGDIYIGLVTTMTAHYTDHGALLIRNSDIKDGKFEFDTEPIYLDDEFAEANKSRMHKVDDVITVHTGDVGTSAVITENEANSIGFATIVTRPNKKVLDSYYLSVFLNTDKHKNWAMQMSTGDGRTNYNLREYTELNVPVPAIDEQKKIAKYIMALNTLITLHQRKYEETKTLKKYMLQKMFPKDGESTPEIRFSGFTDAWEQRKLGEIVEVCSGRDYKHLDEGHIPVYGTGGYMLSVSEALSEKDDAIGIGRKGTIDNPYILRAPFWTVDTLFYCIPKKNVDLYFLFSIYQKINWKAMDESTGVPSLSKTAINSVEVIIPLKEEQMELGRYFAYIDTLITLHQHKCEELQNLKKFMLQNMFP